MGGFLPVDKLGAMGRCNCVIFGARGVMTKQYLDVLLGLLGSMVRINGLFHLLINGVYIGIIAHRILTFDPLTSWDIEVW